MRSQLSSLPRTVVALGFVSFFTDLSSEMIYPLLPAFLVTVLGAGAIALGTIEGIAESTAAVLKVYSGRWADRMSRRKPLIIGGYGLSGLMRPLIGLVVSWPLVVVLRFADRIGKGLRSSPAMLSLPTSRQPNAWARRTDCTGLRITAGQSSGRWSRLDYSSFRGSACEKSSSWPGFQQSS